MHSVDSSIVDIIFSDSCALSCITRKKNACLFAKYELNVNRFVKDVALSDTLLLTKPPKKRLENEEHIQMIHRQPKT